MAQQIVFVLEGYVHYYIATIVTIIGSLIFIFSVLNILCDDQIIDLNSYKHPLPHEEHDFITIAIVGTNDVHGAAFPKQLVHPITKKLYLYGGLEYMSSYINIIKDDFKKSFLWLDAGDQFQGRIDLQVD